VTYSDDQRGYLHPDHLKVHEISVLAFERAGDASWYKNAGPVWQPLKMYYSVWSRVRLRSVHEALLRLRGSSPYDEEWFDRPNLDHRITTKMSVGQYFWARSGALKAHATQVDLNEPFWFGLTDEELAEVYPFEDWILAANHLPNYSPTQDELESDLFAGI
jgi:mycothiol S-conjugate amidase